MGHDSRTLTYFRYILFKCSPIYNALVLANVIILGGCELRYALRLLCCRVLVSPAALLGILSFNVPHDD